MNNVDIEQIQFDYDLVFSVIFMNAHGRIYSRYGGRTPWNSESRVSLDGLKHTMRQVAAVHDPELSPKRVPGKPVLAKDLSPGRRSCMHCHEVWEGLRRQAKANGAFDPESLFVYPRPENIGITLSVDAGNVVAKVKENSPSQEHGIRPGDRIDQIGSTRIYSEADVAWALHNAPRVGAVPMRYTRGEATTTVKLRLEENWKRTKLSWRASMRKEEVPK